VRTNRWIAGLVGLLAAVGVVFVGSPASAAPLATITGTAACDADASTWTVTWTITNATDAPLTARNLTAFPEAPVATVAGIAVGDVVPAGATTATTTVHSYLPGTTVTLLVGFSQGDGTTAIGSKGQLKLPSVCGDPVVPTVDYVSSCDDFVVKVAMPQAGYAVKVDVVADISGPVGVARFDLEPGAAAKSVTLKPAQATSVRVSIYGVGFLPTSGKWEDPGNCIPPSLGTTQLFAGINASYVTTDFRAGQLYAWDKGTNGRGSVLELYDAGAGDIAIRAVDANRFLTVSASTGLIEVTAARVFGDAQKFRLVTNADGTVSLRATLNGKYVSAEAAGKEPLVANRSAIGPWEKFTRYAVGKGPDPILSLTGRFVTAESAGKKPLIANRSNVGLWEMFTIEDLGNGDVALKSLVNGKYVCAESAGKKELIANRAVVGLWETFTIVQNSDYTFSIRAKVNGKYVTAESAGKKPLIANRAAIGPWEKFD